MVPSQFVHRVARGPGLFPMPRFLGDGDRILTTFCRNKKLISWNGFQAVQQIVPKKQQLNSVCFFLRDVIFLIFSRWNNHYKHDHQKPITRVHSIPETVCKWAKLKGAGYACTLPETNSKFTPENRPKWPNFGWKFHLPTDMIFSGIFCSENFSEPKCKKKLLGDVPARRLGSIWLGSMGYN